MSRPAYTTSSSCTCLRLRKASRRVTQIYDHALDAYGLTVTQYGLLGHLKRLDGIALGALADILVMDATTLTRTLKPMQTAGWIASRADADDARARHLHITPKGLTIYKTARPAWDAAQRRIAEALGAQETQSGWPKRSTACSPCSPDMRRHPMDFAALPAYADIRRPA